MVNLQLKRFDPSRMKDDAVAVFIAKRASGKTALVTDILYHKRHIPAGVVMSATEEGNHHYANYVPDIFVHGDYNRDAIEKVIERQRVVVNQPKPTGAYILLDDCMYDKKFMRDTCIRQCFMNGRHWKLFFMLTMQYCMDLTPALRANVDYVFVLRENIIQNREKLYKAFFGIFPTFDMFNQVMTACTENYECLVLDNTCTSNRIEDCVFWYKAKIRPKFRVGSPAVWRFHSKNYNGRAGPQRRARDDPDGVARKRNAAVVNVKKCAR